MYSVYCHTNLHNGKCYIGFTGKAVTLRFQNHCSYAKKGSATLFHKAIRKYGPESFNMEVLATVETENEAKALEVQCIRDRRSNTRGLGYNMTLGGDGNSSTGRKLSKAHRAKVVGILDKTRKCLKRIEKVAAWHRGQKRSESACKAISEGIRAAKASGLTLRQKCQLQILHALNRGTTKSTVTRSRISAALSGKPKERKLSDLQIDQILILTPIKTRTELAEMFGVDIGTITRYRKWALSSHQPHSDAVLIEPVIPQHVLAT